MARSPVPLVALLLATPLPALAGEQLSPPARADGKTAVRVLVRDAAVSTGSTVKARSDTADIRAARVVGPGLVEVTLVPPARAQPGSDTVLLKGKGADGKFEASVDIATLGGAPAPLTLSFSADLVAPGGAPVTVTFAAPPGAQAMDTRQLRAVASAGTLGELTRGAAGWTATWTPPTRADGSHVVAIAAVDPAEGGRVVGVGAIALARKKSITLEVPPDSQNTLTVGETTYGPTQASPAGTVAFDFAVDPRAATARLVSKPPLGSTQDREIDLPRAKAATHAVLLPAPRFAADGRTVPVFVTGLRPDGRPAANTPSLTVSSGTVQGVRETGTPGVWVADWVTPTSPGEARFTARLRGQDVTATAEVVAAPSSPSLSPTASSLAHDADRLSVTVGPATTAAPGLSARGATVDPRPRKGAEGWTFTARGKDGGAWLLADPPDGPTGGPVARLVAWGSTASGADALPVTVLAADAAGLPVAGLPLTVDGEALDASRETSADGLARIWVARPDTLTAVDFTVGGLPGRVLVGPGAPGPTSDLSAWQARAPVAWIPRDDPPKVVLAAADAAPEEPPAAEPTPDVAPAAAPAPAPSPPRPAPPASATPWLRAGISAGIVGHTWSQDADDDIAGPDGASSEAGGLPAGLGGLGAGLHVTGWFGDAPLGFELDAVGQRAAFENEPLLSARLAVGLRGRLRLGDAAAFYAHVGGASTPAWLVVFEDGDPEDEASVQQRLLGGEAGVGVQVDAGDVHLDISGRELLAPWPVQTRVDLTVGYAATESLSIDLQVDYTTRTMAFDIDGESIDTADALTYVGVGATFVAR